jgi:hypothetical protein
MKERYPNLATVRWIVDNQSGAALILDDGSCWRVDSGDQDVARQWLKTTHVFVTGGADTDYRLTDDRGAGAGAEFVGFERFGRGDR